MQYKDYQIDKMKNMEYRIITCSDCGCKISIPEEQLKNRDRISCGCGNIIQLKHHR